MNLFIEYYTTIIINKMKRALIIIAALTLALALSTVVSADVIPPNAHTIHRCVTIVNVDEFPDIYLIGYVTGPMSYDPYIIEQDKCLTMGYKFNKLEILAAKKSYVDYIGVENIELSDENVFISDAEIYPIGGYVMDDNPLESEEIEYSIAGFSGNKSLILYKSKQVSGYKDSTRNIIETFEKPYINDLRLSIDGDEEPTLIPEPSLPSENNNSQWVKTQLPPFSEQNLTYRGGLGSGEAIGKGYRAVFDVVPSVLHTGVYAIRPISAVQNILRDSAQYAVPMNWCNARVGEGLAVGPLRQGHIHSTKRQGKNETGHIANPANGRMVLMKNQTMRYFKY